jgi:hypothetical protein
MACIAVITDDAAHLTGHGYIVNPLVAHWREAGHTVTVCDGRRGWPDADVAILHVDRTRIPDEYAALAGRYPVALNAGAPDLSKTVVSRSLLGRGDDYIGPVIVKTDANAGGHRERSLGYRKPVVGLLRAARDRLGDWTSTGVLATLDYPVYAGIGQVPDAVWGNPALVVERFLPERRGEEYALRQWIFLGASGFAKVSYGPRPVVKAVNVTSSEPVADVPDALREARARLGLDYGKLDYVMHEGEAILLDANRTPVVVQNPSNTSADLFRTVSDGILAFLP